MEHVFFWALKKMTVIFYFVILLFSENASNIYAY